MRRAKIVVTLGPASSDVERLGELLDAGMDVARLNMSHGDYDSHEQELENLKLASQATGKTASVFIDLQGPKIRLGTFAQGPVTLEAGDTFTITTRDVPGDQKICSTTFDGLPRDVTPGDAILIDDGKIELKATAVSDSDVTCEVVVGGPVSDHKGINLPGVAVSVPAMSDKDEADLRWGLAHDIDMVALSFVRSAEDIRPVKAVMDEVGVTVPVIAKIEKPQALENLDAIIDAFDAFMVARGDLGVELPYEDVPLAQKRIIHAARTWAKPVIVATQMLESMIAAPRPTRAEASDVAHAVMDGADAVMLSGETSMGQYPVEAVTAMARIIVAVEKNGFGEIESIQWDPHTTSGVVTWGAAQMAHHLDVRYIVGFSLRGDTVRRLARLRTQIPIMCLTPVEKTKRELGLVWGLTTFVSSSHETTAMIEEMDQILLDRGLVEVGDRVVVIYGIPMGVVGRTNTVYVHKVAPRPIQPH
ncbi:MAG: pyruvate kinase [Propionibacteriaceae bacterium]|jgi:pyruvate kinase|nr:pyruvate kinase [Propionibacteriaceae bacterium]